MSLVLRLDGGAKSNGGLAKGKKERLPIERTKNLRNNTKRGKRKDVGVPVGRGKTR